MTQEELLQHQVNDLRRLLAMKEGVLRTVDDENLHLNRQLAQSQTSCEQLQAKAAALEQQVAASTQKLAELEQQLHEAANTRAYAAKLQMALGELQQRVAQQHNQEKEQAGTAAVAAPMQHQRLKAGLSGMMDGWSLDTNKRVYHDSAASTRIDVALAASSLEPEREEQDEREAVDLDVRQQEPQQEGAVRERQQESGETIPEKEQEQVVREQRLMSAAEDNGVKEQQLTGKEAPAHAAHKAGVLSGWLGMLSPQAMPQ